VGRSDVSQGTRTATRSDVSPLDAGLILRHVASEADAQGAYRLLTSVFEPGVAVLARGLLEDDYPGLKRSHYLIVEDPAAPALEPGPGQDKDEPATAVVSTLCLAPMDWSLQGVRIPVAGLELVATDPRYRVALVLKAIGADPFRSRDRSFVIRHWEEADLPAVAALWDEQDRALDLRLARDSALWNYWFLALVPVLEKRLAASPFRNLSGQLVLHLYSSRLLLAWTNGRLASVTEEPSDDASGPRARLPVEVRTCRSPGLSAGCLRSSGLPVRQRSSLDPASQVHPLQAQRRSDGACRSPGGCPMLTP